MAFDALTSTDRVHTKQEPTFSLTFRLLYLNPTFVCKPLQRATYLENLCTMSAMASSSKTTLDMLGEIKSSTALQVRPAALRPRRH